MSAPRLRVVREPSHLADKLNAYSRGYYRRAEEEAELRELGQSSYLWLRGPLATLFAWLRGAP